jgi:hypothetical protein
MPDRVFIYWDNSNLFIGARALASEREGADARYRVRLHFQNLLRLAHADRPVVRAQAVGSVPPELRAVWNMLEGSGVEVELFERGETSGREQGVDQALQTRMLRDLIDHNGNPGIAVLLTGDGAGFYDGVGFHADIERMHARGWEVEGLSWEESCNRRMRHWVEENGRFICLDDYYESITFLTDVAPGGVLAHPRHETVLDLSRRLMSSSEQDTDVKSASD